MTKKRIWELDALRGLCILGMILFHLVYDMTTLHRLVDWELPDALLLVKDVGGRIFLLLSGLCVTLGTRSVRRGAVVFAAGMLCTLVTWGMYRLDMAAYSVVIRFGVLHCLGVCMLLWPLFKKLPTWALGVLGVAVIAVGRYFVACKVYGAAWLFPLGIVYPGFASGDFYPLFPCLGWFLLGAVAGRLLYAQKQTRFPKIREQALPLRFLQWVGRQSLPIYLLHQPILTGILTLFTL